MTGASAIADAQRIIRERSRRARLFPHMGEAGWLILLDLYANPGRDISVTSACLASFVPPTTALRHIECLERDGLIWREEHPHDRRSSYLRLTEGAWLLLGSYFADPLHASAPMAEAA